MRRVVEVFHRVGLSYGFEELAPPIFEFTEVYKRPLGESSDIVSKEMYSFEDRGGESITLRPEFTAGVCRAFISNGMQQNLPCRLMSSGPAFRYERPQKGRYRQFHQINAELLGPDQPEADVDMLAMAWRILGELGLQPRTVLTINTLGDLESRAAYRDLLKSYLSDHIGDLSEDSQRRLETNPLRILDSKNEGDKAIVANAPSLIDSLNDASKAFYDKVLAGLAACNIPFEENDRLVRGMDYYTHTAFEFVTTDLGAQGTVLAGGRYDGLIAQLGGPQTPGIGWAGGIERLAMLLDTAPEVARGVVIMPMGEAATLKAFEIAEAMRAASVNVTADRSGNMKKRMNRADKANAKYAVIIGDNELEAGIATIKELDTGDQREVSLEDVAAEIVK
jgi:histidyl-tRNA synthetase